MNDNGTISLADSDSRKEFYNLHILNDYADKGDTYNFCPIPHDQPREGILARTEVIEKGPLRGILRLFYEMEIPESLDKEERFRSMVVLTHLVVVDIIVHADSRRVEFKTSWENYSRDHILQLKFRFDEKVYKTIAENNFGLIARDFNPDYSLKAHIPVQKDHELKTNTAPMQRFVYANGLGVITEGLPEYGVDGTDLYITLLRSVEKLSKGMIDTRGTPAGPPLDVKGAQCMGKQSARYALCAVNDPIELFMEADQFMRSILTEVGTAKTALKEEEVQANLFNLNNDNIYTYSAKIPDSAKGVVLRLMNISGEEQAAKINPNSKFAKITELNSLEKPVSTEMTSDQELKFKPFELKSILLTK